jgi:branched-chain amino acid transport system substrate-binding protein
MQKINRCSFERKEKEMVKRCAFLSVIALLMLWSFTAQNAFCQTIKIGMSAAITGPASDTFLPTYEAFKCYFQKVNDEGGIRGQKVEFIFEDDRGESARAMSIVKKFIDRKVALIINASTSATYAAILAEGKNAKIPVLFAGGVCPKEPYPPADPYVFCSTSFGVSYDSEFAVPFMKEMAKGEKVNLGLVATNIPISRTGVEVAEKLAKEAGMNIKEKLAIPLDTADYTPFASKLKDAGCNWIFSWAIWNTQIGVYEALYRLGWKGNYLCWAHIPAEYELNRLKTDNLLVFGGNAFIAENLPAHQEIINAAKKYGATYPVTYMVEGWSAAIVLHEILKACPNANDPAQLLASMNKISANMRELRGGPIEWTVSNHFRKSNYYKVYKWDSGQKKVVTIKEWTKVEVK